jgi:tRNA-dihydrouridine synthase 2
MKVFRTHNEYEKASKRCVLQLGAADAVSALRAAGVFEKDVAAIDINMGCAKHFAVSAGMGAHLMTEQKVADDIIKTLRRNLSIPVSVKTRIFTHQSVEGVWSGSSAAADLHRSCEWLQLLQAAGAAAITVHARLDLF